MSQPRSLNPKLLTLLWQIWKCWLCFLPLFLMPRASSFQFRSWDLDAPTWPSQDLQFGSDSCPCGCDLIAGNSRPGWTHVPTSPSCHPRCWFCVCYPTFVHVSWVYPSWLWAVAHSVGNLGTLVNTYHMLTLDHTVVAGRWVQR